MESLSRQSGLPKGLPIKSAPRLFSLSASELALRRNWHQGFCGLCYGCYAGRTGKLENHNMKLAWAAGGGRQETPQHASSPGHREAAQSHHGVQVHSEHLTCPEPRHRQAALAPHVVAHADGREAGQRRGGRPPDLLQGAAPKAGNGRRRLGSGGGGGVRPEGCRGGPGSTAPPPGRGARSARGPAGGRRGIRHQRPAQGVAADVLAAQDVRGELVLEAAEEAPELRFRAHELRAAGHEELEGVAQRFRAAGQRQLRLRVHHLLLQPGPSFRSVAAAPGGPGQAPPPLHAVSSGAARRPRPRPAPRLWPLAAGASRPAPLATFLASLAAPRIMFL